MLILASASPRRRKILSNAGLSFEVRIPQSVDESVMPGEDPDAYVRRLALAKARACAPAAGEVILAADTTVVVDGVILAKPDDPADAARMLRILSGREHSVLTGICLSGEDFEIVDAAQSRVWFVSLTEREIEEYVRSGEPMDKAGAYGIQGLASKFIQRIDGCYFNVMGLPVSLVYRHLRERTGNMI
ncbi:MAG: Maf family protein [Bryobacteraceae bacterium]